METPDPDPLIGLLTVVSNNFYKGFSEQPIGAIIGLVVLVLLLIASALISSSETAFFSLQPADVEDLESRNDAKSKLVLKLREKPKTLLATILIGNNFVNVTITLLSTYIMALLFDMVNYPVGSGDCHLHDSHRGRNHTEDLCRQASSQGRPLHGTTPTFPHRSIQTLEQIAGQLHLVHGQALGEEKRRNLHGRPLHGR